MKQEFSIWIGSGFYPSFAKLQIDIVAAGYEGDNDGVDYLLNGSVTIKNSDTCIIIQDERLDCSKISHAMRHIFGIPGTSVVAFPQMAWDEAARQALEEGYAVRYTCAWSGDIESCNPEDPAFLSECREKGLIDEDGVLIDRQTMAKASSDKVCTIYNNTQNSWALLVDGKCIILTYRADAEYFRDMYTKLGYDVRFTELA